MCVWLGPVLQPERPELTPRAPSLPDDGVTTIVRQYRPATADLWRQGSGADYVRSCGLEERTWYTEVKPVVKLLRAARK